MRAEISSACATCPFQKWGSQQQVTRKNSDDDDEEEELGEVSAPPLVSCCLTLKS